MVWFGLWFTYHLATFYRWHKGTKYHEKDAWDKLQKYAESHEDYQTARQTYDNIQRIKVNRHTGQPYVSPTMWAYHSQ